MLTTQEIDIAVEALTFAELYTFSNVVLTEIQKTEKVERITLLKAKMINIKYSIQAERGMKKINEP